MAAAADPRPAGPRRAVAVLAAGLLALGCAGGAKEGMAPAEGPQGPPNVVLVTVDTLRADHLSAAGYPRPTSPALDRFAAGGTRFVHAFAAAPCTAPSHASMLTGLPPSFHTVGAFNGTFPLSDDAETLAEALAAAGYATAAVVSNPVLRRGVGLAQGFESYDDRIEGRELNRPQQPERRSEVAVDKALTALAGMAEPFFLWLHLQDPHGPYTPPPDEVRFGAEAAGAETLPVGDDHSGYRAIPRYQVLGDERRVGRYVGLYDDEIAHTDRELGRFLDRLAAAGRLAGTLVVITADHGEALGEDGFYFAHGHSVGLDQVWVPLLVAGPGIAAGRTVAAPVSNAAVFNTVLAAAGLGERAGPAVAGLGRWLDAGASGAADPRGESPPAFFESLNQIGVAAAGGFLRRDRVAAGDERFWNAPNPTTGGFWKPLGRQWTPLAEAASAPAGAAAAGSAEALSALLDAYARHARRAAAETAKRRRQRPLSDEERAQLRALGYAG